MLIGLGCDEVKIGSSDALNFPLFKALGKHKMKIIFSTGMSTLLEVKRAVTYMRNTGVEDLSILQCTSQYPAPMEAIDLQVLNIYNSFNCPVGLSDHSEGIHIAPVAVAMGATIIEKHFTLSKKLSGVDHPASLEPDEFAQMVSNIRDIEKAIGNECKRVQDCEKEHLISMRKSLFSLKDIKRGDEFTLDNVGAKRPGNGLSPTEIDKFLGEKANIDIPEDNFIHGEFIL